MGQLITNLGGGGVKQDSPAFTGIPTAPTPPQTDSSERIATTEYVQQAVAQAGGVIVAATAPEGNANKLWIRSTDGVALYWNGSNWIPTVGSYLAD